MRSPEKEFLDQITAFVEKKFSSNAPDLPVVLQAYLSVASLCVWNSCANLTTEALETAY